MEHTCNYNKHKRRYPPTTKQSQSIYIRIHTHIYIYIYIYIYKAHVHSVHETHSFCGLSGISQRTRIESPVVSLQCVIGLMLEIETIFCQIVINGTHIHAHIMQKTRLESWVLSSAAWIVCL